VKRAEVIQFFCELQSVVQVVIGDYKRPADGFCDFCHNTWNETFQNSGEVPKWIFEAVLEKLEREGKKEKALSLILDKGQMFSQLRDTVNQTKDFE